MNNTMGSRPTRPGGLKSHMNIVMVEKSRTSLSSRAIYIYQTILTHARKAFQKRAFMSLFDVHRYSINHDDTFGSWPSGSFGP